MLQWGVRSLDELRDVVDETMADELACMVREKMLRILADVADFEEAAEEFERTMTQGVAAAAATERATNPDTPSRDNDDVIPERLSGECRVDSVLVYELLRSRNLDLRPRCTNIDDTLSTVTVVCGFPFVRPASSVLC